MNQDRKFRTNRKGQIAFEFIFWIGVVMAVGIILLVLMAGELKDELNKRNNNWVENIAFDIRGELVLASGVNHGYQRQIYIPVSDKYNITIANSFLVLSTEQNQFSLRIPQINGTLEQGNNTIRNLHGELVVQ